MPFPLCCHLSRYLHLPRQQPTQQPTLPRPQAPLRGQRDEGSPLAKRRRAPRGPAVPWAPRDVFTPEGELVLKFGSNGEGNGQFNAPTGVAVDINGNIIVADWGNSRIQKITTFSLDYFQVFDGTDPLYGPQGLALTSDGHVVVADSGNHCFKVYRYLQ
uniref:NHL repeat containing 3 n=1 Tax=Stegastes partitus TaxID=144197 RepID=A0A3B5A7X2_9TELE